MVEVQRHVLTAPQGRGGHHACNARHEAGGTVLLACCLNLVLFVEAVVYQSRQPLWD